MSRPPRRIYCACGCGCFFYWEPRFNRPPAYLNKDHYARERNKRRKMAAKRARDRAAPAEYVAEVLAPVRERLGGLR